MKGNGMSQLVGTHLFLESGWVLAHLDGETVDDTLSRIYGTFVDNYIKKCEAKAELLNSGDLKFHRRAMRAKVKADFMQSNRITLIGHLISKNVPWKAYRIEYHLNRKYAESVNPQDVYAALFKEYANH
jgi:hypothetical protein